MQDGFIKVACATPKIKVADCVFNANIIIDIVQNSVDKGIKLIVFPELCITGYTCQDLFLQDKLLNSAIESVLTIAKETKNYEGIIIVGAPISNCSKLYNCAVVISKGEILGVVPKSHLPNYNEFYEKRHFCESPKQNTTIKIKDKKYLFGKNIIFSDDYSELKFAIEICEDAWVANPPSIKHALNGANTIINLSASDEFVGKSYYRKELIKSRSGSLVCAYLYSSAGEGESTTDLVFGGHNMICEYGSVLAESELFDNCVVISEIDVNKIELERKRLTSFVPEYDKDYDVVDFSLKKSKVNFSRYIDMHPFVPNSKYERDERCETILKIQSLGLKKRIVHSFAKTLVLGMSGGLDSTLALLVAVKAMDMLERPRTDIIAVTMPCFGTTKRTRTNAEILCESLGVTLKTIDITEAVNVHFKDIGHDDKILDVVYENSQARERTQILMDISNQNNGLVVGTGDLSELALGWATYNGDHMSMYGVNAGVPKTLVRHIIKYYADIVTDEKLKSSLYDVLDTPVSPELLPPKDGEISQVTEDIVGPYELHDFFLYYVVRWGFSPTKIFRLAKYAFSEVYNKDVILKWIRVFYKRFFAQQFKRSCLPDSPKVGTVTLSPRGDWRMPSDACVRVWLDELEQI